MDPQMEALHNELKALGFPPDETLTPKEARTNFAARQWIPGPEIARVDDYTFKALHGPLIPIKVYRPHFRAGPHPILMWFHGGGWVLGGLDSCTDSIARHLCIETECIIVTVDYRLSPEVKYPSAVLDCYDAYRWVRKNCDLFHGDPDRISVGGDSAGGTLAITVCFNCIMDDTKMPMAQILVYPVVQYERTESYQQYGEGYILTEERMKWFIQHYLRDRYDTIHPFAAPLLAGESTIFDLPPTLTIAAEFDPLLDEGYEFHLYMVDNGVEAEYICYQGVQHGFFLWPTKIDKAKLALKEIGRFLNERAG